MALLSELVLNCVADPLGDYFLIEEVYFPFGRMDVHVYGAGVDDQASRVNLL